MTSARAANRLAGLGLAIDLPDRWEGRIYRRPAAAGFAGSAGATVAGVTGAGLAGAGLAGEQNHPVLHLANFALPGSRGDYGTGAVERMTAGHVFIALLQFGPDCLGTALYAPSGFPQVTPRDFNPNGLQRRVSGQAGFQHFFTAHGKPLCLYVVLGAHREAAALCGQINRVIERIEVTA